MSSYLARSRAMRAKPKGTALALPTGSPEPQVQVQVQQPASTSSNAEISRASTQSQKDPIAGPGSDTAQRADQERTIGAGEQSRPRQTATPGLASRPRTSPVRRSFALSQGPITEDGENARTPSARPGVPPSAASRPLAAAREPSLPKAGPSRPNSTRSFAVAAHQRPSATLPAPNFHVNRAPSAGPSSSSMRRPPSRSSVSARRPSIAASTSVRSEAVDNEGAASTLASTSTSQPIRGVRGRPGKPPTAFALFREEIRPLVADEAATVLGARFNIAAEVKKRWKALSTAQKQPYIDEAARKQLVFDAALEEWLKHHPEEAAEESAGERASAKKNGIHANELEFVGLPPRPAKAFDIYAADCIASEPETNNKDLIHNWKTLEPDAKKMYIERHNEARKEYETAYAVWKEAHPTAASRYEATRARESDKQKRSVSDDEADYLVEVAQHGRELRNKRLNPTAVSMMDVSGKTYEKGRASDRTYHMARLLRLRNQISQKKRRYESKHGHPMPEEMLASLETAFNRGTTREQSIAAASSAASDGEEQSEAAAQASAGEESEHDESDNDNSDAESVGATSTASTAVPLRERRFAVRTRIVNGELVLDESSLQQSRNDEAAYGQNAGAAIDVNDSDRFVNNMTHAKPRMRSERWTDLETRRFLEAVSMWGSDFEMIARMFPKRDRRQIRARWRSLEKSDPRSLDMAFRRKLPVDLNAYSALAGVDLTGEAAPIEAKIQIKQTEEENDGEQREEDGNEHTVKKSPGPSTPQVEAEEEDVEEDDDLPDLNIHPTQERVKDPEASQEKDDPSGRVEHEAQGPPQILAADSTKRRTRSSGRPAGELPPPSSPKTRAQSQKREGQERDAGREKRRR